jgi:hypothetical protein
MSEDELEVTSAFEKALTIHGYGLQNFLLKEANRLYNDKRSRWVPRTPEFPIQVQGFDSRIDLILKHMTRPLYMVCECKRANPARSNWCFARSPRPRALPNEPYESGIEVLVNNEGGCRTALERLGNSDRKFQIAIDVRSKEIGDTFGEGKGAIESAATQVCRGLNGLIEFFHSRRREGFLGVGEAVGFVPAIITSARIYATEAEAMMVDSSAAEVAKLDPPLTLREWLWYEYPQSPGIKHSVPNPHKKTDLHDIAQQEFIRDIGIVNSAHIAEFLGMGYWRE